MGCRGAVGGRGKRGFFGIFGFKKYFVGEIVCFSRKVVSKDKIV